MKTIADFATYLDKDLIELHHCDWSSKAHKTAIAERQFPHLLASSYLFDVSGEPALGTEELRVGAKDVTSPHHRVMGMSNLNASWQPDRVVADAFGRRDFGVQAVERHPIRVVSTGNPILVDLPQAERLLDAGLQVWQGTRFCIANNWIRNTTLVNSSANLHSEFLVGDWICHQEQ